MTTVIPRDLFNVSKLLKCLGKLVIYCDEREALRSRITVKHDHHYPTFGVMQCSHDGDLWAAGVRFYLRTPWGERQVDVFSDYNSKDPWPLYFEYTTLDEDAQPVTYDGRVLTDDGTLHDDFTEFITTVDTLEDTDGNDD